MIFPDACIVLDFMLAEASDLIERLVVYPDRMRANLEAGGGVIFSQPVMLALVDAGLDRQDAYQLVQKHAYSAWDGGTPLREALEADPVAGELLTPALLDELFDPARQLQHVDAVFRRLGLVPVPEEAHA